MKQRRVGVFTLALILIFLGVAIPLSFFVDAGFSGLLRFAPLALVALGVEVLLAAFSKKEEKLSYDGLSIFLIIVITISTIFSATVVPFISSGVEHARQYRLENRQMREQLNEMLVSNEIDYNIYIRDDYEWFDIAYPEEWGDYVDYIISIDMRYKNNQKVDEEKIKNDIVDATKKIIDLEKGTTINASCRADSIIDGKNCTIYGYLNISFTKARDLTAEDIKSRIEIDIEINDEYNDEDVSSEESVSSSEEGYTDEENGSSTDVASSEISSGVSSQVA